jgi:hypothetical protein
MNADCMRTIKSLNTADEARLRLRWSDGTDVMISATQLGPDIDFANVELDEWGHSIILASGEEIGADRLWLESLSATQRDDSRRFLEWRLANGLSLNKAAEALGIARRTVAYYSNGDRPVPKAILLACRGWEVSGSRRRAA